MRSNNPINKSLKSFSSECFHPFLRKKKQEANKKVETLCAYLIAVHRKKQKFIALPSVLYFMLQTIKATPPAFPTHGNILFFLRSIHAFMLDVWLFLFSFSFFILLV